MVLNQCYLDKNLLTFIISVMNAVDPEITKLIDIGFPALKPNRTEEMKLKSEHFTAVRSDKNLEKLSRNRQRKSKLNQFLQFIVFNFVSFIFLL